MKNLILLILSTLSFLFALFSNYLVNTTGNTSVSVVSDKYLTLFTPADYAFSIWGIIYLLLLGFLAFQWAVRKKEESEVINKTGVWFTISNLANGFWVIAWIHEYLLLSVVFMIVLLFSLIKLILLHRLEIWDAPVRIIAFVWWPICLYTGWIILAASANIASWLVSIDWQGWGLSPSFWTILLIITASLVYLLLIYKRNMREAAVVGIWGLLAIAYRHWGSHSAIVYASLAASVVLFIEVIRHSLKNIDTSPFKKWQRGEI